MRISKTFTTSFQKLFPIDYTALDRQQLKKYMRKLILNETHLYTCRVAKARKIQGFCQVALADRVGISRSHLHKIEKQLLIPTVTTAVRIAHFLKLEVNYLFECRELTWRDEE